MKSSFVQKGFTLVELLIVVIILAILAAIVVPQFANTTKDANISALDSNLANIRSVIDLYAQQHGGDYPGKKAAPLCAGAPSTMTAMLKETQGAFLNQLAYYTDGNGVVCNKRNDGSTDYLFGAYFTKPEIPKNPITNNATLIVVTAGDLEMTGNASPAGWKYDVLTGKFIADDSTNDPSGKSYDSH